MEDFGDLWGPIHGVPAENGPGFTAINTKRGFLLPLSPSHASPYQPSADESACYWCADNSTSGSGLPISDKISHILPVQQDSPLQILVNVAVPETATLLICPSPDPQDEKKQPHVGHSHPRVSNISPAERAKMDTELEQDKMKAGEQSKLSEQSKNKAENMDASDRDHAEPATPDIRCGCSKEDAENVSLPEDGDGSSSEGDFAMLEEVEFLSLWPKVKHEVIDKMIRDDVPILWQRLNIFTCAGEGQRQSQEATSTSSNGDLSQSGSSQRGQKRPREDDEPTPPDDDQNGGKKKKLSHPGYDPSNANCRRLACHFYVRNPVKYQQERACTGPGFLKISRLK
jgi:hypothetical protein